LSQHPGNPSALTPPLVDPGDKPTLPVVVSPPHGDGDVMPGGGTVIIGLTPPLSSSVESSGIAPPLSLALAFDPSVDSDEAVPLIAGAGERTHADVAEPAAATPPPSKVVVAPVVPVVPFVSDDIPPDMPSGETFGLHVEPCTGLKPPGLISVAPSGMPVPLDPIEPGMPSGDVARSPGVLIVVCACAAPQLIRIAVAITSHRRIDTSWSPRTCWRSRQPEIEPSRRTRLHGIAGDIAGLRSMLLHVRRH
jgi:hypothetical protein